MYHPQHSIQNRLHESPFTSGFPLPAPLSVDFSHFPLLLIWLYISFADLVDKWFPVVKLQRSCYIDTSRLGIFQVIFHLWEVTKTLDVVCLWTPALFAPFCRDQLPSLPGTMQGLVAWLLHCVPGDLQEGTAAWGESNNNTVGRYSN